jgi:hypothetical protein
MPDHRCGISVFPDADDKLDIKKSCRYIEKARRWGFFEVFSSLHIPELSYGKNLTAFKELSDFIKNCGMEFSLDISGGVAKKLMSDENLLSLIRCIDPDWLRLDYGFQKENIIQCVKAFRSRGLMLNASVLTPSEIEHQISLIKTEFPSLRLRAHHNYYPKPETGLSMGFMIMRSSQYQPYGLSVTACIASHNCPRLPIKKGLPTVEAHRCLSCERQAFELFATGVVDTVLIGDPFAADDDLKRVADATQGGVINVLVDTHSDITQLERTIAFETVHHSRPDMAAYSIRSQTSREMASLGNAVPPKTPSERKRYDIAIDNENSMRYSGELHIMTCDLPKTDSQNIVGSVNLQDQWKIDFISAGADFKLYSLDMSLSNNKLESVYNVDTL